MTVKDLVLEDGKVFVNGNKVKFNKIKKYYFYEHACGFVFMEESKQPKSLYYKYLYALTKSGIKQ